MVRTGLKIFVISTFLLLAGCAGTTPPIIKDKIVTVDVPVCTLPPVPTVVKPSLYINKLSEQDLNRPGIVAQYYVLSIKQLEDYSNQLNKVIDMYKVYQTNATK